MCVKNCKIFKKEKIPFFISENCDLFYPEASMKDVQITEKPSAPQKTTFGTPKHAISSLEATKIKPDPCGSGSTTLYLSVLISGAVP
jgi:hypothetical protein